MLGNYAYEELNMFKKIVLFLLDKMIRHLHDIPSFLFLNAPVCIQCEKDSQYNSNRLFFQVKFFLKSIFQNRTKQIHKTHKNVQMGGNSYEKAD